MPRHSSIVARFWNDMNKHKNARYRKVDDHSLVELERHRGRDAEPRGRLVAWVDTDTGWGKMAETWGDFYDLEKLFKEASYTDRWEAPELIKNHDNDD